LPSLHNSINFNGTRPVRFSFNKSAENGTANIELSNSNISPNENSDGSNNPKSNYTKTNNPIGPITNPTAFKLHHFVNSPQQQQLQERINESQNGCEKTKSYAGFFRLFSFEFYF
jgi:hypothetical protein